MSNTIKYSSPSRSSCDTAVTKPRSSVNSLRKPFKVPFKVPFQEPPQEVHAVESLDARQTAENHEEENGDDGEIEFAEGSLKSIWRPSSSREELPKDEVLEVELTDFGGDVSVDDSRCFYRQCIRNFTLLPLSAPQVDLLDIGIELEVSFSKKIPVSGSLV